MNRDRMLLGLGVALVVAFVSSVYVYRQLQRMQQGGQAKAVKQVHVVEVAGAVQLGQLLTAKDLTVTDWPEDKLPQGVLMRVEDGVGRAVTAELVQGQVVLDQELAQRSAGAGLSVTIPEGMRAVSVGVDDVVAVAGFVTPGTIVDVLVTGAGPGGPLTRTILEHVKVLAVGQELHGENGKPQTAPVVTLLVSPEDGERLTLAAAEGKIHLALRNSLDKGDAHPTPVYGNTVFMGKASMSAPLRRAVAPKPAPPPPIQVQVIRGDKVEIQLFPQ